MKMSSKEIDTIDKWIIDHIHPNILLNIILMQTDHAIFLQVTALLRHNESIAAMSSLPSADSRRVHPGFSATIYLR